MSGNCRGLEINLFTDTENKIIILNKPLREMFRIYYDKFLDNPILQYTYIACYGLVIIRTK